MNIRFEVFARFWAIVHFFSYSFYAYHPIGIPFLWVNALAVAFVFVRPTKFVWQIAVAVITAVMVYRLRQLSIAEVALFLVNAHWFINNLFQRDSNVSAPGSYYLFPSLIYLAAAIHKLNGDFFDLEKSCISHFMPFIQQVPIPGAIIAGSVVLGYLFVGLGSFSNRTKKWAFLVACCFQSWTASKGIWDFSTALWAGMLSTQLASNRTYKEKYLLFCMVCHFITNLVFSDSKYNVYRTSIASVFVLIAFLPDIVATFKNSLPLPKMQKTEYVFVIAFLFWVLSPYWGGSQRYVFSMYSNLQISPYYTNSFWPSRGSELSRDDWVEISERPLVAPKKHIPYVLRVDLIHWDEKSSLYVPVRLVPALMQDGIKFNFRHKGQDWSWPGNASEWNKQKGSPSFWSRKPVSNGHCQF